MHIDTNGSTPVLILYFRKNIVAFAFVILSHITHKGNLSFTPMSKLIAVTRATLSKWVAVASHPMVLTGSPNAHTTAI